VLTRLQFVQMCKSACGLCKGAKVEGRDAFLVAGGSPGWPVAGKAKRLG